MDMRVEGKRVSQGFNGEEKYDKKVGKRLVQFQFLVMFISRHEKSTYQVIGSQESILRFSVDFF